MVVTASDEWSRKALTASTDSPASLRSRVEPAWAEIPDGLPLTARRLADGLLVERRADILASRERLLDRLKRVTR